MLYRGKTKDVFSLADGDTIGFRFKDGILGRDGVPDNGGNVIIGDVEGKGARACDIAVRLFEYLNGIGVETHYVERLNDTDIRVKQVEPVRIEFIARNFAYGSYLLRYPDTASLTPLNTPAEMTLKDDKQDDPQINLQDVLSLDLCTIVDVEKIMEKINIVRKFMTMFYKRQKLQLIDMKFEFGFTNKGSAILIDDNGYDNTRIMSAGKLLDDSHLHKYLFVKKP